MREGRPGSIKEFFMLTFAKKPSPSAASARFGRNSALPSLTSTTSSFPTDLGAISHDYALLEQWRITSNENTEPVDLFLTGRRCLLSSTE